MIDLDPKRIFLENGLKVVIQKSFHKTFLAGLKVNAGIALEKEGKEGLVHYLEHCLLKGGTEKYSPEKVIEIEDELCEINGGTGWTKTNFVLDVLKEDVDFCLDFMSQLVFKPRFDNKILQQEKAVAIQEIGETENDQSMIATREFMSLLFPNSIFSRFSIGSKETVRLLTKQDLIDFHSQYYHPNNSELYLVGNIPHDIEDRVIRYFNDISMGEYNAFEVLRDKPCKGVKVSSIETDLEDRVYIDLGFTVSSDEYSLDYEKLKALNSILGGDSKSRLFRKVREKEGLAYDICSHYCIIKKNPIIYITTNVEMGKREKTINLIFGELEKLKTNYVTEKELRRTRKATRYHLLKQLESPFDLINALAFVEKTGVTLKERFERMCKVTREDILKTAQKYLPSKAEGSYVLLVQTPTQEKEIQSSSEFD